MASDVKTPSPPVHSRRVQAWVYAIMNPIIESLNREVFLLTKGNLGWRFHSRSCEYIRPVSQYIDVRQEPNYEDFLTEHPNFNSDFEEHDRQVSELESSAAYLFSALTQSAVFQEQVRTASEAYESASRNNPLYPIRPSERPADVHLEHLSNSVAELLVNRTESLPGHYLLHRFWSDYGKTFEPIANQLEPYQQGRPLRRTLENAMGTLCEASKKLADNLKERRRSLCIEYDIPLAPIPVNVSPGPRADAFSL